MKTLNDHIEESLIKSYDTNKLISIIYKKYPDIQYNFNKSKSKEFLFVIYFNKRSDYDGFFKDFYIQHQLDFFGYYITEYNDKDKYIVFEPNFGTKCTKFVYEKCNGLVFHITTEEKYNLYIKNIGLKPFEGKKYRKFSERVFLSCGESKSEIIENIDYLKKQLGINNPVILMIDLKEHKYNVDFYYDPSEDDWHNFIYCNAWFPIKYIDIIEDIDDIKYNINEDLTYDKTLPWLRTNPTNESLLYKEYIKKYDRYNRSDSWRFDRSII